jgi:hypothetical protein
LNENGFILHQKAQYKPILQDSPWKVKKIQSKHTQGPHRTLETFTADRNSEQREEAPDEEIGLKSTCQDRIATPDIGFATKHGAMNTPPRT